MFLKKSFILEFLVSNLWDDPIFCSLSTQMRGGEGHVSSQCRGSNTAGLYLNLFLNPKGTMRCGITLGGNLTLTEPNLFLAPAENSNPEGPYPNLFPNPEGHSVWGYYPARPYPNPARQI